MKPELIHNSSKKQYSAVLGDTQSNVIIGGDRSDRFDPKIGLSRFGDTFLELEALTLNVAGKPEAVVNDKVELGLKDGKHVFYTLDNGNLEWEIEFSQRPAFNYVKFRLNKSANIQAFKQPALTAEDVANGRRHIRPDTEGSYAFYAMDRHGGEARNGKIMHIYRPKLIDADGNELWADMDIQGNVLTVSWDAQWMVNAKYPVKLDPEMGYSTQGGSAQALSPSTVELEMVLSSVNGAVSQLHGWFRCAVVNWVKMGLSNVNQTTGVPANLPLECSTREAPVFGGGNWSQTNAVYLPPEGDIESGKYYAITLLIKNTGADVAYDVITSHWFSSYTAAAYSIELRDPSPASYAGGHLSVYSVWADVSSVHIENLLDSIVMTDGIIEDHTMNEVVSNIITATDEAVTPEYEDITTTVVCTDGVHRDQHSPILDTVEDTIVFTQKNVDMVYPVYEDIADQIGFSSDDGTDKQQYVDSVTDTAVTTDTETNAHLHVESIADFVTATDSQTDTYIDAFTEIIIDPWPHWVTEGMVQDLMDSAVENILLHLYLLGDPGHVGQYQHKQSITDTYAVTDEEGSQTAQMKERLTDNVTSADSDTDLHDAIEVHDELVVSTNAQNDVLDALESLSEAIVSSDAHSELAALLEALSESLTATDANASNWLTFTEDLTEAIGMSDSVVTVMTDLQTIIDRISATDSVQSAAHFVQAVSDALQTYAQHTEDASEFFDILMETIDATDSSTEYIGASRSALSVLLSDIRKRGRGW